MAHVVEDEGLDVLDDTRQPRKPSFSLTAQLARAWRRRAVEVHLREPIAIIDCKRAGRSRGLRFAVVLNGHYCGDLDLLPNADRATLDTAEATVRIGGFAAVLGIVEPVITRP